MESHKPTSASTQQTVDRALDRAATKVDDWRETAMSTAQDASETLGAVADRGREVWDDARERATDAAYKAQSSIVNYAQDEPTKAFLIAAAAGAGLMALVLMLARSDR